MTLLGSIVVGVALIVGAANGLRRGATKEVMALVGVLLGAFLVTMWAERWGVTIAQRTGWQATTGEYIGSMLLLWVTAVFSGYGSAALLPASKARLTGLQRIAGGILGLINAALLVGLTLRLTQTLIFREVGGDFQRSWIRDGIASQFLLDRFDLLVLGGAWTFAIIALVVSLFKLIQRFFAASRPAPSPAPRPAPAPTTSGAPAVTSAPQPTQPAQSVPPGMERSFLDKPGGTPRS